MAGKKERSGKSYDEYDYLSAISIANADSYLILDEDIFLATSTVSPEQIVIKKDAWNRLSKHAKDMANTLIKDESEFNIFSRCHDPGYCDPKRNRKKNTIKKYGKNLNERQKDIFVIAKFFSIKWDKNLPFVRRRIKEIAEFCETF